ncbi:hypothetical protein [Taklimakanibacter lacteus]|uniref:hypothetical protein n=1 Tax=Taklimakanibacter lacteus TaxID=2268456 RepID=UPI0013C493BA
MALDRQRTHEIVQALLRARNRKDGGNILQSIAQTKAESGDRSYREPAFGGMGFPPALRLRVTAGDSAVSQSRKLIPRPRPHPFRDPAAFSDTDEPTDMAAARSIPDHDLLAFKKGPSTLSRVANPQAMYGGPLAVNVAATPQQGYWDSFWERLLPPYCSPTDDNLSFPPLINQDRKPLTEADKDACHNQFYHDNEQCHKNYSYSPEAWRKYHERAKVIRDLCLRGESEILPWSDPDEDGIRFPKPRKRWKRK